MLIRCVADDYLRNTKRQASDYLFPGGRDLYRPLTTRQYAQLVEGPFALDRALRAAAIAVAI